MIFSLKGEASDRSSPGIPLQRRCQKYSGIYLSGKTNRSTSCKIVFQFIICGILSIAVMKTESRRLISWYMLFAGLAFLFALSIFAFSVVAVVNESSIEVVPKRVSYWKKLIVKLKH